MPSGARRYDVRARDHCPRCQHQCERRPGPAQRLEPPTRPAKDAEQEKRAHPSKASPPLRIEISGAFAFNANRQPDERGDGKSQEQWGKRHEQEGEPNLHQHPRRRESGDQSRRDELQANPDRDVRDSLTRGECNGSEN